MSNETTTTVNLNPNDVALVFREDGKLETYLRKCRNPNERPFDNEIVAFVIANLMRDKTWIQSTVNLYNERCKPMA